MKKLILSAVVVCAMCVASLNVSASNVNAQQLEVVPTSEGDNRVEVTADELPEAIKSKLSSDEFTGWLIEKVHLVKGEKAHYEISLRKDAETKTVKLDKEGNKLS